MLAVVTRLFFLKYWWRGRGRRRRVKCGIPLGGPLATIAILRIPSAFVEVLTYLFLDVPHAVAFAITVVLLSRSDTLLAAALVLNIDGGVAAAWHNPICM